MLTFHLAGINNQNFLMRDDETGTFWQQITGRAIAGPLKGAQLEYFASDELSFGLWKSETSGGTVLVPAPAWQKDYAPADWERDMASEPTVIHAPKGTLPDRELVVGISQDGLDRAYPAARLVQQSVVMDRIGDLPILLVVGPDGQSIRAFESRLGSDMPSLEFFVVKNPAWMLVDSASAGHWNFQGCAVDGGNAGKCLKPLEMIKDYWFDWQHYHPQSSIYQH